MNEAYIAALLSWAVALSGYPEPNYSPSIETVSHESLKTHAKDYRGGQRSMRGWFDDGTIYIDRDLDLENDLFARSIVVHEMVHFLQWKMRIYPEEKKLFCEEYNFREQEAYSVQAKFFAAHGKVLAEPVPVASLYCTR